MGLAGGGGSSLPTNRRATGPAPGCVPVKRGVGEVEQKGGCCKIGTCGARGQAGVVAMVKVSGATCNSKIRSRRGLHLEV